MFVTAFPLSCLMAFVNNYVEIRLDAWKLLELHRRPMPRSCEDMGLWYPILEVSAITMRHRLCCLYDRLLLQAVSVASIFVNSGIVAFTSCKAFFYGCKIFMLGNRCFVLILLINVHLISYFHRLDVGGAGLDLHSAVFRVAVYQTRHRLYRARHPRRGWSSYSVPYICIIAAASIIVRYERVTLYSADMCRWISSSSARSIWWTRC